MSIINSNFTSRQNDLKFELGRFSNMESLKMHLAQFELNHEIANANAVLASNLAFTAKRLIFKLAKGQLMA